MISPVKFVTSTLLSIISSLILLWLILAVVFSIQTKNRKKDMIVPPSVSWLNAANDMIDNSLFSGYKFGDEIKGYCMELIDEENMTFTIYTADTRDN